MFLLPAVDLTSVLTPEIMAPILANPEVQQRLMPYLPSGESLPQSTEELNNTLSSPQFQQVCSLPDPPRGYWSSCCGVLPSLLGIFLLCAGYEHVQQRSGLRAVGASDEPVWFACRGC